jgi:hypothetical protein
MADQQFFQPVPILKVATKLSKVKRNRFGAGEQLVHKQEGKDHSEVLEEGRASFGVGEIRQL